MNEVIINTEYVTLGQFLKMVDLIQSGGEAKFFLKENLVSVNGLAETKRGRKLYKNDKIEIESYGVYLIQSIFKGEM